ncbi:transcriptional repressor [Candidatus Parcubacteria bacterium]|nr:MAG: transcriptional repressor [Candidatus Parcubacteria bacterium]
MRRTMRSAKEALQGAGLRRTLPRVAVFSYLENARRPLSIKELQKRFPRIDLVTLYRTLATFKNAGIAKEIHLYGGIRYEIIDPADDHHHIVCTSCRRIEDFADDSHSRLAERVVRKSRSFARLTDHSFELYGLCNTCVKDAALV